MQFLRLNDNKSRFPLKNERGTVSCKAMNTMISEGVLTLKRPFIGGSIKILDWQTWVETSFQEEIILALTEHASPKDCLRRNFHPGQKVRRQNEHSAARSLTSAGSGHGRNPLAERSYFSPPVLITYRYIPQTRKSAIEISISL